tara:strand:+ start:342 stop:1283 length:942 start_codon:yes stop_codon:yes gene_type:complete
MRKEEYKFEEWVEAITFDEFQSYVENRIQRDTESRAAKSKKKHLAKWERTHREVQAYELSPEVAKELNVPQRGKINGHTRMYLKKDGHFDSCILPPTLFVTVFKVNSLEEADELYVKYDSKQCVETAGDKSYSTMKKIGKPLTSARYKTGADLSTIPALCCEGIAVGDKDIWMNLWGDEIHTLDKFDIPKGKKGGQIKTITAPFNAAMVMVLGNKKVSREKVKEFMLRVRNNTGYQSDSERCGARHFVDYMNVAKDTGKGTSGGGHNAEVFSMAIACFDQFLAGKKTSNRPIATRNNQPIKKLSKKYIKVRTA